jgi:hypothetical protein
MKAPEEHEVLEAGETKVERPVSGRDEADRGAKGSVAHVEAQYVNGAGARRDEAAEDPEQRGLAGPVRAEQGMNLAAFGEERYVFEGDSRTKAP